MKTITYKQTGARGLVVIPMVLGLVLGLASINSSAAPGDIDQFSTNQTKLVDSTPDAFGVSSSVGDGTDPTILGGARDLEIKLLTNASGNPALEATIEVAATVLDVSIDTQTTAAAKVQWDGSDGSIALDPTGLGGLDITVGGNVTEFELVTLFVDLSIVYTVTAWSDANRWTSVKYSRTPVLSGAETSVFPFSDFTNCAEANVTCAGGGVDLTSLGALQLEATGNSTFDLTIDSITTKVPPFASLGDRVWNDLNADGVQDCSNPTGTKIGDGDDGCTEPGIRDVVVNLLTPGTDGDCGTGDEDFVGSTSTDAGGFYLFSNLNPGTYCVEFDKPSADAALGCTDFIGGAQSSPQNVGSDVLDSDADPATGQTGNIDLSAGEVDRSNDAGFYCPAKIGDMLVDDVDRDGIQDPGEEGVPGQEVKLVECVGGVPGNVEIDSQFTGGDGMYMFNPLSPGEYAVIFTKPDGTEFSPQNQGGDEAKDCDTNTNGVSQCVTLAPNEYNQDVDACVVIPPAGLGDFVFEDSNLNGIQENGEPGVPGMTVNLLLPGTDGVCNSNDDVATGASTTTGAAGDYKFENLVPGTYCVEFEISSLPANFCTTDGFDLGAPAFTLHNEGDDGSDSDADPLTGVTGNIDLGSNEFDPTNDAGIYCPAKIGDRVWMDDDGDGLQDGSEAGVPNVEVQLFDCGPDGVMDGGDDSDTGQRRYTDNTNGNYMFGAEPNVFDLMPGSYYVKFVKPDGKSFTKLDQGADDSIDSDCRAADGATSCITVGSRGIDLSRDCGLIPPPPPQCDLVIDKTCRVETPPPPAFEKCDGELKQFTVVWTGGDITITKAPSNNAPGGVVTTNQAVTFFAPFADNDVIVEFVGTESGKSKFHVSCSDPDFNSPDDCGKLAGDGKKNGDGFTNKWKLQGFIDKSGRVLECGAGPSADFPDQNSCVVTLQPQLASCEVLGKPTSLTFRYTGMGCGASDNDQEDKDKCEGDVNGFEAVSIVAGDKDLDDLYDVAPAVVAPGELFTISASKFDSNSRIEVSNGGGTEANTIHTSCSKPLEVGDVFGSLELVSFNGVGGDAGTEVLFGYEVTNNGDPLSAVSIEDSVLGSVAGPFSLDSGETQRFTKLGTVLATTTNQATVIGTLPSSGGECSATDEVTVVVEEAPPETGECDGKVTDLVMKNLGADGLIVVEQKKGGDIVFNDFVLAGGEFSFSGTDKKGTLSTEISIYVDGELNTKIHTSCSQPIGPGLVSGDFEVISGNSRNGGALPPL
ncbi:hypothetical protein G8764_04790 [Pseudomaricurvus alcaniphilus]|uniref:SdrD B-like domain-containing protein n=1 Tax=Pseudomaricurvus alcaniphilus TaxID=1166482 RepID=UPI00140B4707|nr:SdrD B-like domain-containing protein [Pseudomaricurvus alcaniphilus]NHN36604.1 hypothetical protein [Pseudomaricurvus alcaniphilus]